jgi:hypothetical protein
MSDGLGVSMMLVNTWKWIIDRSLSFERSRLFVIDGSRAMVGPSASFSQISPWSVIFPRRLSPVLTW